MQSLDAAQVSEVLLHCVGVIPFTFMAGSMANVEIDEATSRRICRWIPTQNGYWPRWPNAHGSIVVDMHPSRVYGAPIMVDATHRICLNVACIAFAMLGPGCASYPADETAWNALESDEMVTVQQVDDLTAFLPVDPSSDHAIAFYPGAKVEPEAYAPLLRLLAEHGVASVLISMPGDLAVLAPKKGDKALDEFGQLGPWYAAGHSLGGAMAATWFSKRLDELEGLALLASYPGGGTNLSDVKHPVVSITASNDRVLDAEKWKERKANLPNDTLYVDIEGGNHAGFGAYGPQDGDGRATLAPEEQWQFTVDHLLELVD